MMLSASRFGFDARLVQRIAPVVRSERFEGIDFSVSGGMLAIATSESNEVLLFRRRPGGRFEETPRQIICRASSGLDYPHDVSFARCGDGELLAVAQRTGAIAVYQRRGEDGDFAPDPVCEIRGPNSKLAFSDGVAFVPPAGDCLAACNLTEGTVSFFRRTATAPVRFEGAPAFELRHPSIFHPDGLAFSRCGRWLAIANHGAQTVSVFARRDDAGGRLRYGPKPVTVIADPNLRYPHSVSFTPHDSLIVTNAGANYFSVYAPKQHWLGRRWPPAPVAQVIAHDDDAFREVNTADKMEGGPKGVAVFGDSLAVCSPQIGVKIYSFRENQIRPPGGKVQ